MEPARPVGGPPPLARLARWVSTFNHGGNGMTEEILTTIQEQLREAGLSFERIEQEGGICLLHSVEKEDCIVELWTDGRLSVQFGMDMDELRTLLAGSTTEDIAEDELQRVARDHLRPMAQRYRSKLVTLGFQEGIEVTEEYYAMSFQKTMDLSDSSGVISQVQACLHLFS